MFGETIKKTCANARTKADTLKTSPLKYFVLSVLAGFYIGIAVYLIYAIGAPFYDADSPAVKIISGFGFTVGLTIVVFAGSELFTGNVLFFTIGLIKKAVKPKEALIALLICYIGNFAGAALFSLIYRYTYLLDVTTGNYIYQAAYAKMNLGAMDIIMRAMLCNMMVCLALWCSMRASGEITKVILIIMCIFTFVASGYIHCVADMTHLMLAYIATVTDMGDSGVTLGAYVYVVFCGTVGNIIGGGLIGAAYAYVGN